MRLTHARIALLAIPLLAGCTGDDDTDSLVAVLVGSVLMIMLLGSLGCSFVTGFLLGGVINLRSNLTRPTARSKRWGWVFGLMNVVNGALGVLLMVQMASTPSEDPPEADVYLYLGVITVAALGLGIAGIVATIRARPEEPSTPAP